MTRHVIFNRKGGVGKSSIAVNLAALAAANGKRTLVVDLDAQANASQYLLGSSHRMDGRGIADFFEQFLGFTLLMDYPDPYILASQFERLSLLPATTKLTDLHNRLESRHKIFKLREALTRLSKSYDAIYIDTPPALNFYTLSALIAADGCLIPFDCDQFSRQALYALLENVAEIRADHNPGLEIEGIVVSQFQEGANLPKRLVDALLEEGLPVLETRLPSSVRMRESHDLAKPLIHCYPQHKLTRAFEALYREIEARKSTRAAAG